MLGFLMSYEEFGKRVVVAVSELRKPRPRKTILVHYGDGFFLAAITKEALQRVGFQVKTFCLEKVYPEVIESLHE